MSAEPEVVTAVELSSDAILTVTKTPLRKLLNLLAPAQSMSPTIEEKKAVEDAACEGFYGKPTEKK